MEFDNAAVEGFLEEMEEILLRVTQISKDFHQALDKMEEEGHRDVKC